MITAMVGTGRRLRHVHATDADHRVTTLELFFDLVFVFAITQVTQLMATDATARGLGRGGVLLALLWFAWTSFAWLGNTAKADEGVLRLGLVLAMGGMFVVALAIPEAYGDHPGGLDAPLVLALAYVVVRVAHLIVYALAAEDDAGLRHQLLVVSRPVAIAGALLVAGAVDDGSRLLWWCAALAIDYGGVYAAGTEGWRLRSAAHFAERHGLIVIIAIGESIVSIGAGVSGEPLTGRVLVAGTLGLAVSVCLWWLYFDVVALVAERVLGSLPPAEGTRLARDSYTYLHFPMVAAIVYVALGMKKVLTYVGHGDEHALSDSLPVVPLLALYLGLAGYLLSHLAFRWRNIRSVNRPRLVVLGALLAAAPVATQLPALVALGIATALLAGLVTFEAIRFAAGREQIRHAQPHG